MLLLCIYCSWLNNNDSVKDEKKMTDYIENSFDSIRKKNGIDYVADTPTENMIKEKFEELNTDPEFDLSDPVDRMNAQIYSNKDREVGTMPLYGNKIISKVADKKTLFAPDVKVHMGGLMISMFIFLVGCMTIALCV